MSTIAQQLGSILVYESAGLCVFLMLLNRRLILMTERRAKWGVIGTVFGLIAGGSAVAGYFLHGLPWIMLPVTVLCLVLAGEIRRFLIRRSCSGRGPIGSIPHAVDLFRPITTTELTVHRYEVQHPHWSGAPLRVVHLTDLHVSSSLPMAYYRHVIERAEETQPDIAVFTGDFISRIEALPELRQILRPIAGVGTFAVLGNHDYWTNPHAIGSVIRDSGLRLLTNESTTVTVGGRNVVVTGSDHPWHREGPPFAAARNGSLHLVLSHDPDNIYEIANSSGDIVFSGHYHAGQIRIPILGPIVVPSVYGRRFDHGHFVVNGTHLFVASGIGSSNPGFRIYCKPDIFVVDIVGGPG